MFRLCWDALRVVELRRGRRDQGAISSSKSVTAPCHAWKAARTSTSRASEAWARTNTADEDVLHQMLRGSALDDIEIAPPCLRVDIKLKASTPFRKPIAMPARTAWAHWVRETKGRLDAIEPLIPEESVRENDEGRLEVVGWQDEPKATIVCDDGGALLLESVEVAAFQIIALPSDNDGFDRPCDEEPEEQLRALFHRVRAALSAWMQTLDHLRPRDAL